MKKFLFLFVVTVFIFTGCKDSNTVEPVTDSSGGVLEKSYQLSGAVKDELQTLTAVTAKYHDIKKAVEDGYVEGPTLPNMGVHFIKGELIDSDFDLNNPEILVYQLHDNGRYELVAIEFAAPIALANPPEGFTGDDDVWVQVPFAGIWALHAWIWKYNPAGVFNGTNPNLP